MKHIYSSLAVCATVLMTAAGFAVQPADFAKKVPISVSTAGQESLGEKTAANVPVLVRLSEAIDGFKYSDLAADGSDLAFGVEEESGFTVYPHEIETWDQTGTSLVWVKVPTLAAATSFGMYYGNGVKTGVRSTDAWSDYTGVWHFDALDGNASTYGSYANSSSLGSSADGEKAEKSTAGEMGRFDRCFRVNNGGSKSGDFNYGGVFVPHSDALGIGATFTISGWFKHADQNYYYDHLFYKRERSDNGAGTVNQINAFAIELNANNQVKNDVAARGSGKTPMTAMTPSATVANYKEWTYFTFVYDGAKVALYANGQHVGTTDTAIVKDNTSRLCFGNNVKGYGDGVGDAAWCGWIDEARLSGGVARPADFIALEYAAMADEGLLAFGAVETMDDTTMTFEDAPTLAADADGHPVLSIAVTAGQGKLEAVYTNLATGESVTRTVVENATVTERTVYTDAPGLAEGATYSYCVVNTSPAGTVVNRAGAANFYVGTLTVTAGANAVEQTLTAGSFVISRADAAGDLVVRYTLSGGEGTYEAMAGEATIPDGATSVTVELKPVFNPDVDADAEVMLTLADGAYTPQTSAASITVVNSSVNIYARYVSTEGDDENDGFTLLTAKKTVRAAIESLEGFDAEPSQVFIAPGEYAETTQINAYKGVNNANYRLIVTNAVTLVGLGKSPADVTLKSSGRVRLLCLDHAQAGVCNLTLANGQAYQAGDYGGGNLYIGTAGGTATNCVITGGIADNYNCHGGNVFMRAGRVTHCVIEKGKFTDARFSNGAAGIEIYGGLVENCLVKENTDSSDGTCVTGAAGVMIVGGTIRNCTIAANTGKQVGGIYVNGTSGKVENCVIVGNSATTAGGDSASYKVSADAANAVFANCVVDADIVPNATCVSASSAATLVDAANGDFHLAAGSPAIDFGRTREDEAAGDLDLRPRVMGNAVDAGCYEYDLNAFSVAFEADCTSGILPVEVTFTATVSGASDGDRLQYLWDFDGDGTVDETVDGETEVRRRFTVGGTFSPVLTVRNLTAGKELTIDKQGYLHYAPKTLYVNESAASHDVPFATAETGAATLNDAVDAAVDGCEIVICPGTYNEPREIQIEKLLDIHGQLSDPTQVVLTKRAGTMWMRIVYINKAASKLSNVTIANGALTGDLGAGIRFGIAGGTVSNAVIRGCSAVNYNGSGAAAYLSSEQALLTHAVIEDCFVQSMNGSGGNKGVVQVESGRVENCLVTRSTCPASGTEEDRPGNVIQIGAKGRVTNCTVVGNTITTRGIVFVSSSTARLVNCVIAGNEKGEGYDTVYFGGSVTDSSACVVNCVIDPEDLEATFKNYAKGDFTPAAGGPLCNAGAAWDGAPATDLAGRPRVQGRGIDIGCYEAAPAGFVISIQ